MTIFATTHSAASQSGHSVGQTGFFTTAEKTSSFKTVLQEVREKGLVKYAEEQRIEKLREKILAKLGITEEKLRNMTAEQRAELLQRVEEEIQKILAAERELNRSQEEWALFNNHQVSSQPFLDGFDMNNGLVGGKVEGSPPLDLFKVFSEMDRAQKDDDEKGDRTEDY